MLKIKTKTKKILTLQSGTIIWFKTVMVRKSTLSIFSDCDHDWVVFKETYSKNAGISSLGKDNILLGCISEEEMTDKN